MSSKLFPSQIWSVTEWGSEIVNVELTVSGLCNEAMVSTAPLSLVLPHPPPPPRKKKTLATIGYINASTVISR